MGGIIYISVECGCVSVLLAQMPPRFPGMEGSGVPHSLWCKMYSSPSTCLLLRWAHAAWAACSWLGLLMTHDPGSPANQTPLLEKLKPEINEQWEVKLEGAFWQSSGLRRAAAATTRKIVGQTPGLNREWLWAGREQSRERARGRGERWGREGELRSQS